jgi:hypothetical protein
MDILPVAFLVWVSSLVTELLNSSPTGGFHVAINVSTNRICEAYSRAGSNKLKPAVLRMRWPLCYGHASRLLRLNIIHAT